MTCRAAVVMQFTKANIGPAQHAYDGRFAPPMPRRSRVRFAIEHASPARHCLQLARVTYDESERT
jgi:hypothetical protein